MTFQWHLSDSIMTSPKALRDLSMSPQWPLSDLSMGPQWPLDEPSVTPEWLHSDLSMSPQWPLSIASIYNIHYAVSIFRDLYTYQLSVHPELSARGGGWECTPSRNPPCKYTRQRYHQTGNEGFRANLFHRVLLPSAPMWALSYWSLYLFDAFTVNMLQWSCLVG